VREIIEKLMATEEEAKSILAQARQESTALLRDAQTRAQELLERAQREARDDAERILKKGQQQAAAEEQECLARADTEIASQVRLEPSVKQRAVRAVVRCVIGDD
jgi:ATP synthase H subunit